MNEKDTIGRSFSRARGTRAGRATDNCRVAAHAAARLQENREAGAEGVRHSLQLRRVGLILSVLCCALLNPEALARSWSGKPGRGRDRENTGTIRPGDGRRAETKSVRARKQSDVRSQGREGDLHS